MDWTKVIGELSALGYTQPQIAERCKCVQGTISDLARGHIKDPRFTIADGLLKLLEQARRDEAKRQKSSKSPEARVA